LLSPARALEPSNIRVAIRAKMPGVNPPINMLMKKPVPRIIALMLALPN